VHLHIHGMIRPKRYHNSMNRMRTQHLDKACNHNLLVEEAYLVSFYHQQEVSTITNR
jgi:hypothetical protein